MAFASWWYATHGDKKSSKPVEKKETEVTEKKSTSSVSSQQSGAQAGGGRPSVKAQSASAAATKESPMKPSGAKEAQSAKPETAKTQSTKPSDTKHAHGEKQKEPAAPKSPTKQSGQLPAAATTAKQTDSTEPAPSSQDAKSTAVKSKEEPKPSATKHAHGEKKEPAVPKSPTKQPGQLPAAATTAKQTDSTEPAPSSQDAKSTAVKSKEEPKSKKESKPTSAPCESKEQKKSVSTTVSSQPGPEAKKESKQVSAGTAAVAAGTAVAAAGTAAVAAGTAVAAAPCDDGMDAAIDDLLDTLGGPEDEPPCPTFTGPQVTEATNTATYVEELGKRESTIPPEYRKLLEDNDGKAAPPPKPEDAPKPMSEDELADEFSKDFVCSSAPTVQSVSPSKPQDKTDDKTVLPPKAKGTPKDKAGDKVVPPPKAEVAPKDKAGDKVVPPPKAEVAPKGKEGAKAIPPPKAEGAPKAESAPKHSIHDESLVKATSIGSVSSAAPPDEKKQKMEEAIPDSALDELMGSLEGPEENEPECPEFTGPEVTEATNTATYVEELGKRESSIPPEYRKLLENKDGKAAPPPKPEDTPKPFSEDELADEFSKDFTSYSAPPVQTVPSGKPKDSVDSKAAPPEEVVSQSAASAVQSAVAPTPCTTTKAPADPLDTLAGTLGKREPDPQDAKPAVDKVKEKTDKDKREKLGEDEETIPHDYRLKEVKDKDGKPLLPKPEVKPQPMTDTELVDAFSEGFVTSPATTLQSAPPPKKDDTKSVGAEKAVSCSTASAVHAGAPLPGASNDTIPDDLLDTLSGTLGTREVDPNENKPAVDVVKEKSKSEHVDKLGERDDTIPPEYRHLLDDKGKPTKPAAKEEVKPEKPKDDAALLDALSEDFCSTDPAVSAKAVTSQHPAKDKNSKDIIMPKPPTEKPSKPTTEAATKPTTEKVIKPPAEATTKLNTEKATKPATEQACKLAIKDDMKPKDTAKAKEQSSSAKPDTTKTSKS
ncbi:calpastatin isoform X2 [Rhinatrema bivittatum]|uniref:calpastatin isoform X2 n=1 Tax=Rhinatrema bivittatum TaxID=194408 RepID=UPI0011272A43|nr:calpastatin isoform X2 [Rhinatrema bivittatum]